MLCMAVRGGRARMRLIIRAPSFKHLPVGTFCRADSDWLVIGMESSRGGLDGTFRLVKILGQSILCTNYSII